jgi:hypothetical protein
MQHDEAGMGESELFAVDSSRPVGQPCIPTGSVIASPLPSSSFNAIVNY